MATNADPKRVYDGFVSLEGGVDTNSDPCLLPANELCFLGNASLRSNFPNTRPPFIQNLLVFDNAITQANYSGIFQGACFYEAADESDNSLIVSIGGHLFRIYVNQNFLVREITPSVAEVVTAQFTVPAGGSQVNVYVTGEQPFAVNQVIMMDGGNYTINTILSDELVVTYNSGAAHATVAAETSITDVVGNQLFYYGINPATADFVYLYQAENYIIGLCENQATLIFDGSSTRLASQGASELPSSYAGTYAWGRNWLAQVDGHHFVASDLVGDPSGTPALVYVDAILKMTENNVLNGGGAFSTPANLGTITAMSVLSQLDSSLGIGPVLVGTLNSIFSVQAPVDRTTWQSLTYPIQSVAVQGRGPTGPRAMLNVNSDCWFRALDGVSSMMAARRDFNANNSNTPNSIEMSQVFDFDTPDLLFYSSIASFDNRILFTASPQRTANGVSHQGIVVLNQDDISSINKDGVAIWEGLWTGLNVCQLVTGNINGANHCYAFALNNAGLIDLWEILPESQDGTYDVSVTGTTSPNLIPSGSNYSGDEWLLTGWTFGATYKLVWGVNEAYININGVQTHSTGVGTTSIIVAPSTGLMGLVSNSLGVNGPVTAYFGLGTTTKTLTTTPVFWWLETRSMNFGDPFQFKKLIMADLNLDRITDTVGIKIYWRPDQYPLWTLWTSFNICANVSQCSFNGCPDGTDAVLWKAALTQYGARIRLPRPPEVQNLINNTFMDRGNEFQFRIEVTGGCRIRRFRLSALQEQSQQEGSCPPNGSCSTLTGCLPGYYGHSSYGI